MFLIKSYCILLALLALTRLNSSGQLIIWQENFNGYPDGTTLGANNNPSNPDNDWFAGSCGACIDTADWWEIRSGTMEARDVNEVVFFQTEEIDISSYTNVQFLIYVEEIGDHEGPYFGLDACADQANEDYVNVLFRIDGGSWNLVKNFLNWCGLYGSCDSHTFYGDDGINSGDCRDNDTDWGSATVAQSILSGNLLEIRVETINSSDTEIIRFDNLVVEGNILLPVTLKTFKATARANKILLHWQTVSESNNDYFQVERSPSGNELDWIPIETVAGAGNSNQLNDYFFEDLFPYHARYYYRLKQVDFDGRFSYSQIVSAGIKLEEQPYPNPAVDHLIIPLNPSAYQEVNIGLFDLSGKCQPVLAQKTKSFLRLDLSGYSVGTYFLRLSLDGTNQTHRLVIIH